MIVVFYVVVLVLLFGVYTVIFAGPTRVERFVRWWADEVWPIATRRHPAFERSRRQRPLHILWRRFLCGIDHHAWESTDVRFTYECQDCHARTGGHE